jgi:hypothetical protein
VPRVCKGGATPKDDDFRSATGSGHTCCHCLPAL